MHNNGFFGKLDLNIEEEKYQIGKHKSAKEQPNWEEEDKLNFMLNSETMRNTKWDKPLKGMLCSLLGEGAK